MKKKKSKMYGMNQSARNIFGIHEDCLIMKSIWVLRDGGKLDVILLFLDLRVHEKIKLIMGAIVMLIVWRVVQILLPIRRRVKSCIDDVIFYFWSSM